MGDQEIFAKKIVQKYLQKYNQNICKKILPKYLEKYYQNAKQILMMIGEGVRGGLIWTGSAQNCTNTNHATYFSFLLFGRINLKTNTNPPIIILYYVHCQHDQYNHWHHHYHHCYFHIIIVVESWFILSINSFRTHQKKGYIIRVQLEGESVLQIVLKEITLWRHHIQMSELKWAKYILESMYFVCHI